MELIIVAVVAVVVLVVLGGLFVGRSRGRSSPPIESSSPGSGPGGRGKGAGTDVLEAPTDRPSVVDSQTPTPAPDTDVDPYPGGPDLLIDDSLDLDQPLSLAQRFRLRLGKASGALGANLRGVFAKGLNDEAWEELEDSLIAADVGVEATMELVGGLRERVRAEGITDGDTALALLKEILRLELGMADRSMGRRKDGTSVWLFTGVNGTGKTTSIGKLAKRHVDAGDKVVLAAADTFRAAASEQLEIWGERAGARVVRQDEGADPAAVAYDGWKAATAANADLLMIDTAGRLQNKAGLMAELSKVKRVVEREAGPIDEVLLVLDATTGQNGLTQAQAFTEAVDVTGVVLTKLDGTAKGGIVIAIQRALDLPVKLVGLGEGIDDLAAFDPDAFIEALFAEVIQDVLVQDGELDDIMDNNA
ncbi:MAG: signal recognition particle-docking protein FtsY [Euzebya sp.]